MGNRIFPVLSDSNSYYPSVQNLTDSVHALNGHLMVSIWPNPTTNPQADDFKGGFY